MYRFEILKIEEERFIELAIKLIHFKILILIEMNELFHFYKSYIILIFALLLLHFYYCTFIYLSSNSHGKTQ